MKMFSLPVKREFFPFHDHKVLLVGVFFQIRYGFPHSVNHLKVTV